MAAQFLLLPLDILPAVDDECVHIHCRTRRLRDLGNLDGQLARRRHDECLRHGGLRLDFLEDRQQKGQRLARARLRLRDAVVSRPYLRDGLCLNGRRLLDAVGAQHVAERLRDAQSLKCRHIVLPAHEESTSAPVSVMRIVLSHCAESFLSFVRTVQPSPVLSV